MLDTWEDLSSLGLNLLNFPFELKYGKMVLYAVVLKCVDPVLSIVASLASTACGYQLTSLRHRKRSRSKTNNSNGQPSDHFRILKEFTVSEKLLKIFVP